MEQTAKPGVSLTLCAPSRSFPYAITQLHCWLPRSLTSEHSLRLQRGATRDHGKNFRKRKHVQGLLFRASQCFTAAYCLENKKLLALDGYHRAYGLAKGQSYFMPGATIQLSVLVVDSMEQVRNVYDQYDSPDARKKSLCYFESGLNEAGMLGTLTSDLLCKGPRAYAVQFAAEVKGGKHVRSGVVKLARGIAWLDSLGLRRQNHVIAGVLGAYMAIAQYAPHKDIAAEYLLNLNNPEFKFFGKMKTHEIVEDARNKLAELHMRGKTGAHANMQSFLIVLQGYLQFLSAKLRRPSIACQHVNNVLDFINAMAKAA